MAVQQSSRRSSTLVPGRIPFADKKNLLTLGAILLVTFICYIPALTNEFVNWDDYGYVVDNTRIREFSLKNILSIFTTLQEQGNYHPLTMLSYNIEYQFFGQNPHGYHVTNIILHLINTGLVFWLFSMLSGRTGAIIVSLLFGIHTLHVESVAWVSERKDLLYTLFYFLALIYYLKYTRDTGKKKMLLATMGFFLLSVLSKAMAVSLVVVLPLVDFFLNRKFDRRVILEKIPFLIIALIFGVVALFAQQEAKAIHGYTQHTFVEKVIFACYGLINYLIKLIAPIKLSAFYPFPQKIDGALPASMWLYPALVIMIAAGTLFTLRRTKKVFFGMAFFLITVALVLQVLQVGGAVMADRYMYIPALGFFYLLAEGFTRIHERQPLRMIVTVVLVVYCGWLCVLTWERAGVWRDSFALWTDTVAKYERIGFAFANRGYAFYKIGKYDEALADYNKVIALDPTDGGTYHNRGVAYYHMGRNDLALADYNKAIELKVDNAEVYNNRGAVYAALGSSEAAITDFTKAISMSAEYAEAYNNRGTEYAKAGMYEAAITDFDHAIRLKPDYTDAVKNKEVAVNNLKAAGGSQLSAASTSDPEYYLSRGLQYGRTGNTVDAIKDFDRAIQLRPSYAEAYNNRGIAHAMMQNYVASFADFSKAIQIKPDYAEAYFNRGVAYQKQGDSKAACADFSKAASLGSEGARRAYQESCR